MKGLFYKDFITLIKTYRVFLIMVIFFMVLGTVRPDNMFWAIYGVFFLSTITSSLFALDEQTKWLNYYDTLPLKRKDLVTERYCITVLLTLAMMFIFLILCLIQKTHDLPMVLMTMALMLGMTMLASSLSLPINIRFGSVKGQLARMMVILVTVVVGMTIITQAQGIIHLASFLNMKVIIPAFAIGVLVIFLLSWRLSVKFLEDREF